MQCVTNHIVDWSQQNKFELNLLKCKEIMDNLNRQQPDYVHILVNRRTIERVEKAGILGLVITDAVAKPARFLVMLLKYFYVQRP